MFILQSQIRFFHDHSVWKFFIKKFVKKRNIIIGKKFHWLINKTNYSLLFQLFFAIVISQCHKCFALKNSIFIFEEKRNNRKKFYTIGDRASGLFAASVTDFDHALSIWWCAPPFQNAPAPSIGASKIHWLWSTRSIYLFWDRTCRLRLDECLSKTFKHRAQTFAFRFVWPNWFAFEVARNRSSGNISKYTYIYIYWLLGISSSETKINKRKKKYWCIYKM